MRVRELECFDFDILAPPLKWRRQDFFRVWDAQATLILSRAPSKGSDVSFFKQCKVLENEPSFQTYQHFSSPKNIFFKYEF